MLNHFLSTNPKTITNSHTRLIIERKTIEPFFTAEHILFCNWKVQWISFRISNNIRLRCIDCIRMNTHFRSRLRWYGDECYTNVEIPCRVTPFRWNVNHWIFVFALIVFTSNETLSAILFRIDFAAISFAVESFWLGNYF